MDDCEPPEEEIGVRLRLFVDQLEVEQRDLLAEIEPGFDRPHQQRALAHLTRALDRQRLPELADDGERRGIGGSRQIPRILDVERAAGDGQRRRIGRRLMRSSWSRPQARTASRSACCR